MAVFSRKIGRLVTLRNFDAGHQVSGRPKSGQIQPARITAVGAGTLVTCKVLFATGATYTDIPRWSRATPSVMGWDRT